MVRLGCGTSSAWKGKRRVLRANPGVERRSLETDNSEAGKGEPRGKGREGGRSWKRVHTAWAWLWMYAFPAPRWASRARPRSGDRGAGWARVIHAAAMRDAPQRRTVLNGGATGFLAITRAWSAMCPAL